MGCVCCCDKSSYDIAGNRIRRGQTQVEGEFRRRGRHVLRVFAQTFELVRVFENQDNDNEEEDNPIQTDLDDEDQFDWLWSPLCDFPVHVSLACIQEGEIYEYTIYAEESEVCPLTSFITIPGTEIKKTGSYFIQWTDIYSGIVYGLNFFTEQEALRFLSSCFPPSFTPDTAIRHASSRPSYSCPSPPPPVTDLPFLNNIPIDERKEGPDMIVNPRFYNRSSTPEQAEEFFRIVVGPIKPLHNYYYKPTMSSGSRNHSNSSDQQIPISPSNTSMETCVLSLPRADSISSELSSERALSGVFPSPPSMFMLDNVDRRLDHVKKEEIVIGEDTNSEIGLQEETDSHENDDEDVTVTSIDEVELYQSTGPIEINKVLADIPEEEEEEQESDQSTKEQNPTAFRRKQLKRMDSLDMDTPESSDNIENHTIHKSASSGSVDSTLQDFDRLLQDLKDSQLLEITQMEQKQTSLSRQSSYAGPPPHLPQSLPPGPTLSPYHSMVDMEGAFDSLQFKNALRRLSVTSIENALSPEQLSNTPEDNLVPPHQSLPSIIQSTDQLYSSNRDSLIMLPPIIEKQDSGEFLYQRQGSFLRYQFQPPEQFSSVHDSGFADTGDEEKGQKSKDKKSQLFATLQASDLTDNKAGTSVSSSMLSETTESQEDGNPFFSAMKEPRIGQKQDSTDFIRKTGWLQVKIVLVRKNKKVAMKSRRRWKKHWAILKGNYLILYNWDTETTLQENTPSDARLDITKSLAYPVNDHIKRDNLFCLSTSNGNTYYMQAISQTAVEDWIQAIHSASALALTNRTIKEKASVDIIKQISDIEESLEKERRVKNLAELQYTSTNDTTTQHTISKQIKEFSENIDKLNVDLYRAKCYLASLQGTELPNPQSLLAAISKPTKAILNKIGVFSVSSLHAVISIRSGKQMDASNPSFVQDSIALESTSSRKRYPFNFFGSRKNSKTKARRRLFITPTISHPLPSMTEGLSEGPHLLTYRQILEPDPLASGFGATLMVELPNKKVCAVPFRIDLTVGDIIFTCCKKFSLDPADHFLNLRTESYDDEYENVTPHEDEFISNLTFTHLEIRQKFIRTVHLSKSDDTEDLGVVLKPDLRNLGAITHAVVGKVTSGSKADINGLSEGDEVVLLNDIAVSQMTWNDVTSILKESSISLTIRTCQVKIPQGFAGRTTHFYLRDLVCPSPPTRGKKISPEKLDNLIVPRPTSTIEFRNHNSIDSDTIDEQDEQAEERVHQLIKGSLEVTGLVGRWKAYEEASIIPPIQESTPGMTPWQRMMKCVQEIVDTEIEHVKMLEVLVDRYLVPLQQEKFIQRDKMATISNSIQSVVVEQKQFKGRIEVLPEMYDKDTGNTTALVQELSDAFQVHLDTFKQYNQFCAAQYELETLFKEIYDRQTLEQFLEARNPKQDPKFSLPALLSQPMLRLLRYPLFLQALKDHTDKDSKERNQLMDTITDVVKVTEYINEVQRITESYAQLFDQLLKESGLAEFGVSVRVSQLQSHMTAMWLNPKGHGLTKTWRKGQGPDIHCFIFNTVLVLLCVDQPTKKRVSKASIRDGMITTDDITHSILLPLAQCKVNDLPDSDGVTAMWQVVQKGRQMNSKSTTYLFRSQTSQAKAVVVETLHQAIQDQLALYGSMNVSISPTMSTISGYGSPSRDSHMMGRTFSLISRLTNQKSNDSFDSEYELSVL